MFCRIPSGLYSPPKSIHMKTTRILQWLLLLLPLCGLYAQRGAAPPCASDGILKSLIAQDPELKEHLRKMDQQLALLPQRRSGPTPTYTIPVVVYVVHGGTSNPENISDAQVNSQIAALNNYFAAYNLKFCLATRAGNSTSIPLSTTAHVQNQPGIIHVQSTQTDHTANASGMNQLAQMPHYLVTKTRYLRIWVVKTISGAQSGIMGYAMMAGTTSALDGIVMRADVFGNSADPGCGCPGLIPIYNQGKILVHEVGHYLGLYHTFEGGCAEMGTGSCANLGDRVCDTPPVAGPNYGCVAGTNSCSGDADNDLIHNYMDYGDNACIDSFTPGQVARMIGALTTYRSGLSTQANILYTGTCGSDQSLTAEFLYDSTMPCAGDTVSFTALGNPTDTYSWDFGDGATDTGANVTHTFSGAQPSYNVTLTASDGTNSTMKTVPLYVTQCAPIGGPGSRWPKDANLMLDFSTGVPRFDPTFPTAYRFSPTHSFISKADGQVAAIANTHKILDGQGNLIHTNSNFANPEFNGAGNHNEVLFVPRPGSPGQHYLFINVYPLPYTPNAEGFRYGIVDVNGASPVVLSYNVPISAPTGYMTAPDGAVRGGNGLAAIEKCDGYWLITTLIKNGYEYAVVYSVTAAGISFVSELQLGNTYTPTPGCVVRAAPNGNKVFFGGWISQRLVDFDKVAGVLSEPKVFSLSYQRGSVFSPDSQILYAANSPLGESVLNQFDLNTANPALTAVAVATTQESISFGDLQIGPDNKIYVSHHNALDYLSVIHKPNVRVSSNDLEGCYFRKIGPYCSYNSLPYVMDAKLPNIITSTAAEVYDNTISAYRTGCQSYKFFPNFCGASFSWEVVQSGSVILSSATNTPSFTFPSSGGDFTVRLKNNVGQVLATTLITIQAFAAAAIEGDYTACLPGDATTMHSIALNTGDSVNWTVSGGSVVGPNGQSGVSVLWTSLPGTLTATVTNASGCVDTSTKTILPCVNTGANNTVYAVQVLSSGKILIGGAFTSYNGTPVNHLARLHSDMTLDTSFASSGTNGTVRCLYVQADGKIVVGGEFTTINGASRSRLARLLSSGLIDKGFTANVTANGSSQPPIVYAVEQQSDGKLIIGGYFYQVSNNWSFNLARVNTNGSFDSTFGSGFNGYGGVVKALAIQPDGKIWIGGDFWNYFGLNQHESLVRILPNGGIDNSAVASGTYLAPNRKINVIRMLPSSEILVGGEFYGSNGMTPQQHLVRLSPANGAPVQFLQMKTKERAVFAAQRDAAGRFVVGGGFFALSGPPPVQRRRIVRLTSNFGIDTTFDPGEGFGPLSEAALSTVYALAIQPDGKIVVGGSFDSYNGFPAHNITRIDNIDFGTISRIAAEDVLSEMTATPNPVSGLLRISGGEPIRAIRVFNVLGQQLLVKQTDANEADIDFSNLGSGQYIVKVECESGVRTFKILRE